MEIYRVDSNFFEIDYVAKYDHMDFNIRFKEAVIFDLTGYPYTINPKEYAENPNDFIQTTYEMASIKASKPECYGFILML
jgi:hypothetical protein